MSSQVRVSVLIPTFNQSAIVGRAIESALAQDVTDLEVVVCDDASTDGTEEAVRPLLRDPRLRYVRNETNLGRVANYRKLLYELARGDWVLMLDGDDYLVNPHYLSKATALAHTHHDIVLVFGKAISCRPGAKQIILNDRYPLPAVMDGNWFFLRYPPIGSAMYPLHLTCLYKRARAIQIGFYQKNILTADGESFFRLMLDRKIAFLSEIASAWTRDENTASANPSTDETIAALECIEGPYQMALELAIAPRREMYAWYRRGLARFWLAALRRFFVGDRPLSHAVNVSKTLAKRDPLFFLAAPASLCEAMIDRAPRRAAR